MDFLIADTFTASLVRLTGNEQKAAKTTAFDLEINPATPGHGFHKLSGAAKDPRFWSVRVGSNTPRRLRPHARSPARHRHQAGQGVPGCFIGRLDNTVLRILWSSRNTSI